MKDKRYLVLYGFIVLVALVLIAAFLLVKGMQVSDTESPSATSTPPVVATTTKTLAETPSTAAKTEPFRLEIVTTQAAQARGLGGRSDIPSNYGMLFVFPEKGKRGFWMKDMLAPIDIIWISDDKKVLGVEGSISPTTYPEAFYPPEPVRYVLETKAGEAQRLGLTVGTSVNLPLP